MDNSGDLVGTVADWNAFPRRRRINSFAVSRRRDSAGDQPGDRSKSSLESDPIKAFGASSKLSRPDYRWSTFWFFAVRHTS